MNNNIEEMKRQEAELLGDNTQPEEQKKIDMQEEIMEAQRTGVVDMNSSEKDEGQKSQNYTHTFKKPVTIMGQQYKTLTFYFERLTGADIEAIETEMQARNQYALSPEVSSIFQSMLAARAAGIGHDELRRLPLHDYMQIKNKARNFLVDTDF